MPDEADLEKVADNLVDFADFFLCLGELQAQQVLVAIADRDPQFTYYIDTVADQPQTLLDLFRLYGKWVIDRSKTDSGPAWNEVVEQALGSDRYRVLKMQWQKASLLWEEWEGLVGRGEGS